MERCHGTFCYCMRMGMKQEEICDLEGASESYELAEVTERRRSKTALRETDSGRVMADEVKALWRQYLLSLQRHPLRTKAITAGVLAGSADMVAQKLAGAKNLQFKRASLLMLWGLCYSGPFGHFFHKFMDTLFPPARDSKTIVSKVIVEQLTASPWNNFLFMSYLALVVEGRPWSSVKSHLKSNYPSVQLNAWRFWPLVGLINYKYLPIQLRVLFHNLAAVCWGVFLILRSRASVPKLATA